MVIWDDYVSVISPKLYLEFCREPNERIYKTFGSRHLHTCGPILDELIQVMLQTEGCASIDLSTLHGRTRTREDLLCLKSIVKNTCVLIGSLAEVYEVTPTAEELARGRQQIDLELVRQMNAGGGFIWIESGTLEEGAKFSKLAKEAMK